jgi:hypothetical protein
MSEKEARLFSAPSLYGRVVINDYYKRLKGIVRFHLVAALDINHSRSEYFKTNKIKYDKIT